MDTLERSCIVDTAEDLAYIIPELLKLSVVPPSLFVDLEGYKLCRNGTISLITIHAAPLKATFLIDVFVLGASAFSISAGDWTLKRLLEDENIPKVLFDCRNDCDALYNLFQIDMKGVKDVQLMELATRRGRKTHLNGLRRTIENQAGLTPSQLREWKKVKDQGSAMFNNNETASVAERRPVDPFFILYSVQDVVLLPKLYNHFDQKLNNQWRAKVEEEVLRRLQQAHHAVYNADGPSRALAPLL